MNDQRVVSLTLNLSSTSREDAVRQFITAVGLYGMGAFDFQVFEGEEDMIMVNGREAMRATMHDSDEHQEVKDDQIRTDMTEAYNESVAAGDFDVEDVEDVEVEWPDDPGDEEE